MHKLGAPTCVVRRKVARSMTSTKSWRSWGSQCGVDRVPQGGGAARPGRAWPAGGVRGAGCVGAPVWRRAGDGRADRPPHARGLPAQRCVGGDRRRVRGGDGGEQRGALRHPETGAAGRGHGGRAGPAQPGGDGRVVAAGPGGVHPHRRRDGPAVRPLPRRGAARRAARGGLRVRPAAGRASPAAVSRCRTVTTR